MSSERIEKHIMDKWSSQNEDNDETESPQFISLQKEPATFLRRAFSFQIGKTKELFKLDSETRAMIKLRYKDISKHVIWSNCALPKDYNSCLTLNSVHSKYATIRHNHAGNHQATISRVKDDAAGVKDFTTVPFDSPKTFPRTTKQKFSRHQKQQLFYTVYPAQTSPSTSSIKIKREKRTVSLDPISKANEVVVDIDDDRTPIPKRTINSVRRSESSDENEPIVNLTAPRVKDESGFYKDDVVDHDNEPDVQIWRL